MTVPSEVLKEIESNRTFLISTHINPEGDALGSALALGLALQKLGKQVMVVNRDPVPRYLDFLPYRQIFQQRDRVTEKYDVLAVLDCGDLERTAIFRRDSLPVPRVLNIDHHVTNKGFGHVNWIQVDATATGEMVYELMKALGIPMTADIALCLYTTIVTETGSFRYSNTTGRTFLMAADLLKAGINPSQLAQQLFERNTHQQLRLLGELLLQMEFSEDRRIAWIAVDRDLFSKTGTSDQDTEDFIGYPRSVEGVEVAIFFRQLPAADGYKLSFRSRGKVDVSRLAERFGGGGHRNAAGCTLPGRLKEVQEKVLPAVREAVSKEAGRVS